MNRGLLRARTSAAGALAATLVALGSVPAAQAADIDVGVSIAVSQPGVYGRIDIGRFPAPQVVVAQPVIVAPPRAHRGPPPGPVYMWVPPGHQKNWRKHCQAYGACGVPVVFVRDDWYQSHVMPQRRGHDDRGSRGRDDRGKGKGPDRG